MEREDFDLVWNAANGEKQIFRHMSESMEATKDLDPRFADFFCLQMEFYNCPYPAALDCGCRCLVLPWDTEESENAMVGYAIEMQYCDGHLPNQDAAVELMLECLKVETG